MASATLDGFPDILRVDVFQASGAAPGKVVVDTLVYGADAVTSIPRITTLTLSARDTYVGVWDNLKIVKKPRVYAGNMRTVLADSRWRLADVTMGQNYNDRDCNGIVYPDTAKTISQLVSIIAAAASLTITTAGSLPTFKPVAAWRGKTAAEALQSLLDVTGCRMVYNPVTQGYVVSAANSGTISSICDTERRYRPGPEIPVRNLIVKTAPITYESRLSVTAVAFNDDNELETIADPDKVFDNWDSYADGPQKTRYQQTAFRLWDIYDSSKCLLGRRAMSIMPGDDDQAYCAAYFIKDSLADVPKYVPLVQPSGYASNALSLTAGGKLFQCEHPYIQVNASGTILTAATVLCAYYSVSGGVLARDSSSTTINGSATSDLTIIADWIKPVSSSEDDIDGSEWTALLAAVTSALVDKYSVQPQHITVGTLVDHGAIGQIGAVRYSLAIGNEADVRTAIAFNFDPADSRGL